MKLVLIFSLLVCGRSVRSENLDWLTSHSSSLAGEAIPDKDLQFLDGIASITTPYGNHTTKTFGFSDIPNMIRVSENSHFPMGSNSKLYTAVAVYQLHEEGKLDVTADISSMLDAQDFSKFGLRGKRKLCPRLPYSWRCEKITLQDLLSMSSGIYPQLNCDADPSSPEQCNPVPYVINSGSIAQTVGTFLTKPLMFRPGTEYHYSNPNFVLATYFVEKYSGMTFRDYLTTHIFSKIGLNDTYYDFYNQALRIDKKRVSQYFKYYDNVTSELMSVGADVLQLDLGAAAGTGGLISTAHDQVSFWYALFNKQTKGAPLVTKASQDAILAARTFITNSSIVWKNATMPIWVYYTQGVVVICSDEDCPLGPRWIQYTGGTVTVKTANMMDYTNFAMSQVWTSTVVLMTDRETFEAVEKRQTGTIGEVVENWANAQLDATHLCLLQMFSESPPMTLDVSARKRKKTDS